MSDALTHAELRAFAHIFRDHVTARHVLDDSGFPPGQQPIWEQNPMVFWREVSRAIEAGVVRDGRRRLLAAAVIRYPENPIFAAPDRVPVAEGTPSPSTGDGGNPPTNSPLPAVAPPKGAPAGSPTKMDFFISVAAGDEKWAEWILERLEHAGYRVRLPARETVGGSRETEIIHTGLRSSRRVLALLTRRYLEARNVRVQWQTAFRLDPVGAERGLIPIRVEECEPDGVWDGLVYIDLVGLDEGTAAARLTSELEASLLGGYPPPPRPAAFPG